MRKQAGQGCPQRVKDGLLLIADILPSVPKQEQNKSGLFQYTVIVDRGQHRAIAMEHKTDIVQAYKMGGYKNVLTYIAYVHQVDLLANGSGRYEDLYNHLIA